MSRGVRTFETIKGLYKVGDGSETLWMFIRYYTGELSAPDVILLDTNMLDESLSIIQIIVTFQSR